MRIKQRNCDFCGSFYTGRGDYYCSAKCASRAAQGYRVVALPDVHLDSLGQMHPSYLAAKRFVKEVKPQILILLGDFMEMGCFSRWNKNRPKLMEERRYLNDVRLARQELEELRPHVGRMVYLEGNHEHWLSLYLEEHPVLEGKLDLQSDLGLAEMGIEWVAENQVFSVGKLNFIHGWFINKYHAEATLRAMGDHCWYGHTHDQQLFIQPIRADRQPYKAQALGCLTNRNPCYRRHRPTDFVNGFGIFEVRGDGCFNDYAVTIIDGVFSYGGETWHA